MIFNGNILCGFFIQVFKPNISPHSVFHMNNRISRVQLCQRADYSGGVYRFLATTRLLDLFAMELCLCNQGSIVEDKTAFNNREGE